MACATGSRGSRETWSHSRYILKKEPLRCPGRMGVGLEKKGKSIMMAEILGCATRGSCRHLRWGSLQGGEGLVPKEVRSSVFNRLSLRL